ncbi:MAG TPA: hypothetical protein VEJ47_02330 [Candidatus Eremiobacteraceae bacterium]|nr:hypothetical protein [Candidatus Eremiobacteraceae bacterium]
MRFRQMTGATRGIVQTALFFHLLLFHPAGLPAQARNQPHTPAARKVAWHTVEFAIVRFNENAPNSWNIYHSEKKGVFLVRLWKRYLLVNVEDQEVYDIDPQKIKVTGDAAEWSLDDVPDKPIDTPDFTSRNVGTMERIRFRLSKDGHFLELQIPLGLNGRPLY